MKKIFLKLLVVSFIALLSLSSISIADGHTIKEIIIDLKKEIIELGETPVKRKALQNGRLYIEDLKVQKEELEKEKAKQAKIDAVKNEIIKELEKLGEKPLSEAKDIDTDEEIIALRKQLDDLKKKIKDKEEKEKKEAEAKKIAAEKEKIKNEIKLAKEELINELKKLGKDPVVTLSEIDSDEDIKALRNQLKAIKEEVEKEKERIEKEKAEKKKKEETKQARLAAVQEVKKNILFLGETPISEFEATNNDEYIAALNEQLAQIKAIKEQEEKDIQQSIPTWFIKLPKGTEKVLYVRGTAVVDTLQGSIDSATNAALRELGKKLETRLNSKIKETVRQAGVGEDQVTKSEMNRVSSLVVKEVTISGYEIADTKLVQLDNGSYRSFILLEYPIAQVYKAFINRVEGNENLKSNITALKNTEAFKELEQYVAEFSGA
jgi:DNA repair exonuclease SbcCD ATPase subunit